MSFPDYPNVRGVRYVNGEFVHAYQPSGSTIALDLLGTPTVTSGTLTGGLYHIGNSVWTHFSMDTAYEVQTIINITLSQGVSYTLTVGTVVLTSGALGASPTIGDLVSAFQADSDYNTAPFTVVAVGSNSIKLTWKNFGSQTDVAILTDSNSTTYTTIITTKGGDVANTSNGLLAAGERIFVIPHDKMMSFVKATGQNDGIIRITRCE